MWTTIVDYLIYLFSSVFSWLTSIFNAIPGSWDTLFTLFVIFMIARYLLGPVLGVAFSAGSDVAGAINIARMKREQKEDKRG